VGETTEIIERQMFKIEGKEIVLRPEGTAQVIRYYLENSLHKQSDFHKFYYIGPMFRGERPQRGRLRQFHHIGAEAIGSDSIFVDAEAIVLALKILDKIGVANKKLKINTLGCVSDKEKFSVILKKALYSKKNELCQDCQRRLERNPLRVIDCKEERCKAVVSSLNLGEGHLCDECKKYFKDLLSLLDALKIQYTYAPSLVRGLDYYTNTVFEIISDDLGSQDAIGAGGRYNNLIESLGGPKIPAIGFALGVERIILVLKSISEEEKTRVFIVNTGASLIKESFGVLERLREEGIACDMDYCGKSLKGQLRYAEKKGARFVVILADTECKEGYFLLKDMGKSTQEKIKIGELISVLNSKFKILNSSQT
jgi:histidyl-tRNA synthetase